jgi:hypothetical protein
MTRGINYRFIIVITAMVGLILINTVLGYATNQNKIGLMGQVELSEEFLVSVRYFPDPKDPSRLSAVNLEISTIAGEKSINQVLISTDSGSHWVKCTQSTDRHWICANFAGTAEIIRDIKNIEIVVN